MFDFALEGNALSVLNNIIEYLGMFFSSNTLDGNVVSHLFVI